MPSLEQAVFSCRPCRSQKRRCDRRLPKCSLCSRKNKTCSYFQASLSQRRLGAHRVRANSPSSHSGSHFSSHVTIEIPPLPQTLDFPPVLFLDWDVFRQCRIGIPQAVLPLPGYVADLLGDRVEIQKAALIYFDTVHTWLPIVSRIQFNEKTCIAALPRADYVLLALCMKLITWRPSYHSVSSPPLPPSQNPDPRTLTYLSVKRFYLDLEISGVLSIQVLQAGILIALYEIGHAIYPSAFMSIGTCARYGCALGIDWNSKTIVSQPFSWVEMEERNRAWWAVVMLDRVANVGCPHREFLIKDPTPDTVVPADDVAFDLGTMPAKPNFKLSSPTCTSVGRFVLMAQAIRHLSQVIKHIAIKNNSTRLTREHRNFHEEEALLLDRALRSLIDVAHVEGVLQDVSVMNQTAICTIALQLLHESHTTSPTTTKVSTQFSQVHQAHVTTALVALARSERNPQPTTESDPDQLLQHRQHEQTMSDCVDKGSPFLATVLYQAAVANLRVRNREQSKESFETVDLMRAALADLDCRWRASGAYLEALEARIVCGMR